MVRIKKHYSLLDFHLESGQKYPQIYAEVKMCSELYFLFWLMRDAWGFEVQSVETHGDKLQWFGWSINHHLSQIFIRPMSVFFGVFFFSETFSTGQVPLVRVFQHGPCSSLSILRDPLPRRPHMPENLQKCPCWDKPWSLNTSNYK